MNSSPLVSLSRNFPSSFPLIIVNLISAFLPASLSVALIMVILVPAVVFLIKDTKVGLWKWIGNTASLNVRNGPKTDCYQLCFWNEDLRTFGIKRLDKVKGVHHLLHLSD